MRVILMLLVVAVVVAIGAISLGYVDIHQTRTAALPSVELKGGQAPAYDVRAANVTIGEKSAVVSVPTVGQKNTVVEVPTVNVQKPN
jgi:hypothetical protein